MTSQPRRIAVIGGAGSGKTSFARRLSSILGAPHIELDSLHWDPDWTPVPTTEFRSRVDTALSGHAWIADGNYQGKLGDRVLRLADTVVWLDPGRPTIMWRVITRTIRRAHSREVLWNGNRESWGAFRLWRGEESIIWWAWTSAGDIRETFGPLPKNPALAHVSFHRLRSRRDVDEFLETMSRRGCVSTVD
ncbi:hypothetical protein [Brevibacterium casei]